MRVTEFYTGFIHDSYYLLLVNKCQWFHVDLNTFRILSVVGAKSFSEIHRALDYELGYELINEILAELEEIGLLDSALERSEKSVVQAEEVTPVTVLQLHVSHHCNLACTYCYAHGGNYGGKTIHMSPSTAKRAVDFLLASSGEVKQLKIVFFGGEPLLNLKVIKEVVTYCQNLGKHTGKSFQFSMTTNGTLLSTSIISYLKQNNIRCLISMDGPKDIHNRNRPDKQGTGSFDIILKNVRRYKKVFNSCSIRSTLWLSEDDIQRIYEFFKQEKIKNAFLCPINNPGPEFYRELIKQNDRVALQEMEETYGERKLHPGPFDKFINIISNGRFTKRPCGAGQGYLAVAPDGDIYFCHRFVMDKNFRLGSVWDTIQMVRRRVTPDVDERISCKRCWARYHCGGQCYQECHELTGDIVKPNRSFCRYVKHLVLNSVALYSQRTQTLSKPAKLPIPSV